MSLKLRLKLSDFMGTILEDDIMNKIAELHQSLPVQFELVLWYTPPELVLSGISKFLEHWEPKLKNKTHVIATGEVYNRDSVFFNIVRQKDTTQDLNFNFEYVFSGHSSGILTGLDKFGHAATFCYSDKTVRKQKRNDYA